ncbi:MAG: hypothetical protein GY928_01020 [Colwellia sp.]|nr:hypothetical protein [Colwellia sp.]
MTSELNMCKAIAKLEGVEVVEVADKDFLTGELTQQKLVFKWGRNTYNPVTDLALNCRLRDKYEVHTDYINNSISTWVRGEFRDDMICNVEIKSKEDIPRAVCECILKSEGFKGV